MKKYLKKFVNNKQDLIGVAIITSIVLVFFWKVFLKNYVLAPVDMLVGSYYPWHEHKWGYAVDVIIKNPLLTDVFSQFYVWKKIIADSYRNLNFPLWNPYSYSGYPLLANYHSGALYIFNIIFVIFNFVNAWNIFVIFGILFSSLALYLVLRNQKYSLWPSVIASITYGLSGYSISWSEFATAGQSMIWIPVAIFLIGKFIQTEKKYWLGLLSLCLFLLITSGHLQMTIYGYAVVVLYFLYKWFQINKDNRKKSVIYFSTSILISVFLAAIQLLPTYEMGNLSIRNVENYAGGEGFGILPIVNIVTMFIPDYFGNPTTYNYWGFFNYHETIIYSGFITFFALIWSFFNFKNLSKFEKFFFLGFLSTIVLLFDNPLIRLIYNSKFPILSTFTAGRIVGITTLCLSILLAAFLEKAKKIKFRDIVYYVFLITSTFAVLFFVNFFVKKYFLLKEPEFLINNIKNINITIRNMILPFGIFALLSLSFLFRNKKIFYFLILLITIVDLYRFGWKYMPMADRKMAFPKVEIIDFLINNSQGYRVDKEYGPLLPPNTWSFYNLQSPSGYDPMAQKNYTNEFYKRINDNLDANSRYAETHKYDCEVLGDFSVKYILALNWREDGTLPGNSTTYKIDTDCWKKVFSTEYNSIFENSKVKAKYEINASAGNINLINEQPGQINLTYDTKKETDLIIRNAWYPGWIAYLNGTKHAVEKYDNLFQKVDLPSGQGEIILKYEPESFKYGMVISAFGLVSLLFFFGKFSKR